jgi:hypothetical protein
MGAAAAEADHRPGDRLPMGDSRQGSAARSAARGSTEAEIRSDNLVVLRITESA